MFLKELILSQETENGTENIIEMYQESDSLKTFLNAKFKNFAFDHAIDEKKKKIHFSIMFYVRLADKRFTYFNARL